jgi:hypothetical protein
MTTHHLNSISTVLKECPVKPGNAWSTLELYKSNNNTGADDEEMYTCDVILMRNTPATGVCRPNLPNLEPKAR